MSLLRVFEASTLWRVVRHPLRLLFVLGCFVSIMVSGRLAPRLVLDGMVSFGFIPVFEILALVLLLFGPARVQPVSATANLVDQFGRGHRPWLWWFALAALVLAIVSPREIGSWFLPTLLSAIVPLVLSLRVDFNFFRQVLAQPHRVAFRSLVTHRLLSWVPSVVYFLGVAIWYDTLPAVLGHLRT